MRVAIAHWQGRVAPVFDVAGRLLLVDVEGGVEQGRRNVVIDSDAPRSRVKQLAESGADVLICGAISWPLETALRTARVRVIPQTCGEVETILETFISGKLSNHAFLMPGCPHRRQAARMRQRRGSITGRSTP
jgi:predicted Fe-Mo cluster-binding NifX family protein